MLELELVWEPRWPCGGAEFGLIRHLEVDIRHASFWSLEITEAPGKALLKPWGPGGSI